MGGCVSLEHMYGWASVGMTAQSSFMDGMGVVGCDCLKHIYGYVCLFRIHLWMNLGDLWLFKAHLRMDLPFQKTFMDECDCL